MDEKFNIMKYQKQWGAMYLILITLQLIFSFSLPNCTVSDELKCIEKICEKVKGEVYVEHAYAKYLLDIVGKDIRRIDEAKSGDRVIWDKHRTAKIIPITYFGEIKNDQVHFKGWNVIAAENTSDFIVFLLEKQ